ncbi:MAG: hypothetical protein AAFU65_01325 [Pseudomonadota bacterium]
MADRLPGDYLNYLQVWQQKVDENPLPDAVEGLRILAVEQPGEFLLVERYVVGLPESSVRRWLRPAQPEGRFEAFTGPESVSFDGVIDASDLTPDPACDMTLTPGGASDGGLTAATAGDCALTTGWDDVTLAADGHLRASVAGESKVFKRARWFKGWMGVKRQTWDPEAADDDWVFMGSFQIHNEGDIVRLVDEDGTPTGFSVQLERLVYQNTRTPVLKLGLIDEDKDKTIHYIWSEPGSRLLGMNLRWFQVGLTAL